MYVFRQFLICTLFIFTSIYLFAQSELTGAIEGLVKDAEGKPIPGITVRLEKAKKVGLTDSNGKFSWTGLPAGEEVVLIEGVNIITIRQVITVNAGSTLQLQVEAKQQNAELKEVIVSAGRTPETLDEVPSAISIINRKELEKNIGISTNLGMILGNKVTGLAPDNELSSNSGQTLRGRVMLIMVDGVPQSTPLRNGGMDLRALDPSVIERVEVVKGATAIYGNGAAGGLINYITRKAISDKPFNSQTSIGLTGSLVKLPNSMGGRISQLFYGSKGKFDYTISGVFEQTGELKDAEGDVLPPVYGLGETDSYNAFLKLGYQIKPTHRVQFSYNYFKSLQSTNYITENGNYSQGIKTSAVPGEGSGVSQGVRGNHNASLQFTGTTGMLNTSYDVDLYYQSVDNVFFYSETFVDGGVSRILSRKKGLRFVFNTPIPLNSMDASLTYGLDIQNDITSQPLVDGRIWVPEMDMMNLAPFVQAKLNLLDRLVVKGGVRLEKVSIGVDDYATLPVKNRETGEVTPSKNVEGGELNYNAYTFNAGLRYNLSPYFSPFISFSQGFSVADIGLALRAARADKISQINTEAVIINNYEAGFVSKWNTLRFEANAYISTSELGASSVYRNGEFVVQRTPERIYGFELAANAKINSRWNAGLSYSYVEGKTDINDNGNYDDAEDSYLGGQRIAAPKISGEVDFDIIPGKFNTLLQYIGVMRRDKFELNNTGNYNPYQGPVKPYNIVNLRMNYVLNPSTALVLGIENLLNENYYTARSQYGVFNDSFTKGKGASFRLTLNIKW
ncbi:TonB-dependent receptor [Flavihumibacter sp. UBA7668]|uniref:TonB-dependent receptor n=1 Tax=Flavihumibacter sp. UBA7668 TaxID=1946542 RepID=UPI0025C29EC7|nr:TonB-dependent receptor [Flavihumibacter sp. UBA7668]